MNLVFFGIIIFIIVFVLLSWFTKTSSKKINIICPDGLTLENTGHNSRGKDRIPVDKVLKKTYELIN